jgi:hypothetical protein
MVCFDVRSIGASTMKTTTIQYSELSEPVRSFIVQAASQGEVVVRDESNGHCYTVRVSDSPAKSERALALEKLAEIQERVAAAMAREGLTEEDLDRALLEDE